MRLLDNYLHIAHDDEHGDVATNQVYLVYCLMRLLCQNTLGIIGCKKN